MSKYVIRRLLLMIPTMIAVIFIVFSILNFIPGDPGRMILGISARPEAVEMFNHNLGLDRPFLVRFFDYVGGIFLHFDFGESYRNSVPVIDEMMSRFPATFTLATLGVISVVILGVPLGILAAIRRSTITDASITVYAMFLTAIPGFWFGLVLMYFFALKLKWVPVFGVEDWKGYILPIITMSVPGSSGLIRLTRVTMLETVNQEYIKTARAKGAPEAIVIWKHALKNAVLPIINSIPADTKQLVEEKGMGVQLDSSCAEKLLSLTGADCLQMRGQVASAFTQCFEKSVIAEQYDKVLAICLDGKN